MNRDNWFIELIAGLFIIWALLDMQSCAHNFKVPVEVTVKHESH